MNKLLSREEALGKISLQSAKSGAGEQLLPLDCRAKAHPKGVYLFTDTGSNLVTHALVMMASRCYSTLGLYW